jgi:hypothetical protein
MAGYENVGDSSAAIEERDVFVWYTSGHDAAGRVAYGVMEWF